jgi:hypothetical protein
MITTTKAPGLAALRYAARCWAVFPLHGIISGRCSCRRPCPHPAKHPLTRHGLRDATTEAKTVQAWWERWPWANVGIATGAISGIVVIVVDPRAGAAESLAHLQSLMGSLPETLAASTGGGGQHLVYAHPGVEMRNTAGRLPGVTDTMPGLDLRGDGGYIVGAPSRHASGAPYRWIDETVPVAPVPAWLRPPGRTDFPTGRSCPPRRGGGSRYGIAALRGEVVAVRAAPVGDRNNRLNRAAFSLAMLVAGGELDALLVEEELLTAALEVGLTEAEAQASIGSGMHAGRREPRRPVRV